MTYGIPRETRFFLQGSCLSAESEAQYGAILLGSDVH